MLGPGGVAEVFGQLQMDGLVRHVGLTAIGSASALSEVVQSGRFDTIQVPYNLVNPSAGMKCPADFVEVNYGDVVGQCAARGIAAFAIRVYAGGAASR